MSIHVTPIPKLIDFATPSITIGATAAAGSALTAIRSDSTIAGVALVATTVDESIARYAGTGGQLQGYTSNSPTISDAGVISLTSGQLTFPASVNVSADPNTLDDFEEGSWSPIAKDGSGNPAGSSSAVGRYTRIGNIVSIQFEMTINSLSGVTEANNVTIYGLPFTALAESGTSGSVVATYGSDMSLSAAGVNITGQVEQNTATMPLRVWDTSSGVTGLLFSELTAAGVIQVGGTYRV
tara:strand:+ start:645 stop:1361 length:717 start_codon:yes stop_codon:yes gene_type:complete